MKAIIVSAVIAGALAGPAFAQGKRGAPPPDTPAARQERQKQRDADTVDRQYQSTVKKTQADTTGVQVNDPWQNMRGAAETKTETKIKTKR